MAGRRGWGQWRELRGGVGVFLRVSVFCAHFCTYQRPSLACGKLRKRVEWRDLAFCRMMLLRQALLLQLDAGKCKNGRKNKKLEERNRGWKP